MDALTDTTDKATRLCSFVRLLDGVWH